MRLFHSLHTCIGTLFTLWVLFFQRTAHCIWLYLIIVSVLLTLEEFSFTTAKEWQIASWTRAAKLVLNYGDLSISSFSPGIVLSVILGDFVFRSENPHSDPSDEGGWAVTGELRHPWARLCLCYPIFFQAVLRRTEAACGINVAIPVQGAVDLKEMGTLLKYFKSWNRIDFLRRVKIVLLECWWRKVDAKGVRGDLAALGLCHG